MKPRTWTLSLTLLIAASSISLAHAATATKSHAKAKIAVTDACSKKPSKWQRLQCEEYNHSAPGDRYFGRMKLSYLGINNTFRDASIEAGSSTTDSKIVHNIYFANEAFRQWASLYPNDPELARSYFLAFQIESKIYLEPQQHLAWQDSQTLIKHFPTTYFGKLMKADLQKGFTEHWYAATPICGASAVAPFPGTKVSPTPVPTPMPSPTAAPAPRPGQPNIDVITPPCVMPATPSPAPSVSPAPSLAPLPQPTPTA